MLSKSYVLFVFGIFFHFLGMIVTAHMHLNFEILQFVQNEMVIWFFVIYLPLFLLTIILDAKKVIDIRYFFANRHRLGLLVCVSLLGLILGYNEISPDLNKFFFWLMF